jgi:hypothetical protein
MCVVSAAGVILTGAACAHPASAVLEGAADSVGSTVKSVHDTATSPLPSGTPPATPAPTAKPAAPQLPVESPTAVAGKSPPLHPAPSASPQPRGDSVGPSAGDGVVATERGAVSSVTAATAESLAGGVASEREDTAPVAVPSSGPDANAGRASAGRSDDAPDAPISVRAAEVATLQRWLARVWPAIALGGGGAGGGALDVTAADFLRPALVVFARLLRASSSVSPVSGDSSPSGHSEAGAPSQPDVAPAPSSSDGGGLVYLIALAGLLALLAFTVWREFDVALRPWQHRP